MAIEKKTTSIPSKTAADVLYKSNLQCCICQEKGVHIHHLNGKNQDHRLDNLAYLCFSHHDDATITGSLSRKLSKETIIKYREQHYQVIINERERALGSHNHIINQLTEEQLLIASKNALIIIELENIKEEYFNSDWKKREDIITKLHKYSNHANNRLAYEILDFLNLIAGQTRSGMPNRLALTVYSLVMEFCPSLPDENNKEEYINLSKTCIHIGENIAYDSFIHLRNLSIAMWGLTIIKYVYRLAKEKDISELKEEINRVYDGLKYTLLRPERNDLSKAQELLKVFRDDLDEWDLAFPVLPDTIMDQVIIDEKKIHQKRRSSK